jgi:hypothetical protein
LFLEETTWISAPDGLLARDINGNGRIDDGGELFSEHTVTPMGNRTALVFWHCRRWTPMPISEWMRATRRGLNCGYGLIRIWTLSGAQRS